jgi:hypothetical protein
MEAKIDWIDPPMWWKFTVKCSSGGVHYRARGYVRDKEEAKQKCHRAVLLIARGALAEWETLCTKEDS